jgi:folate-dependent phosphoribosylglycinamide formyltransferase PurN
MGKIATNHGVTMHLVTPELDKGPPVTYCTFPTRGRLFDRYWKEIEGIPIGEIKRRQGESNPLFRSIRQQGLAKEFPLIIATLKAFSDNKIRIEQGKVVDAQGKPIEGYDLTEEINKIVKVA